MRTHKVTVVVEEGISGVTPDNLKRVVEDANDSLWAGVNRRYIFDNYQTVTKIVPGGGTNTLLTGDFPFEFHLKKGDTLGRGTMGFTEEGGGLCRLVTPRIPNPADSQFNWFIDILDHEKGHNHGGGLGEFYNLTPIPDTTGIEPQVDVSWLLNPQGPLWGLRPDWHTDPMFRNNIRPRKWSNVNRLILLADYRLGNPRQMVPIPLRHVVKVFDQNGEPTLADRLGIYYCFHKNPTAEVWAYEEGVQFLGFDWSENEDVMYSKNAIVVKAFKAGYQPVAQWVTVYDLQEAFMNGDSFDIEVHFTPLAATAEVLPIRLSISGQTVTASGVIPGEVYDIIHTDLAGGKRITGTFQATGEDSFPASEEGYYRIKRRTIPQGPPPPPPGPWREMPEMLTTCEICTPPQFRHITEATPAGPRTRRDA